MSEIEMSLERIQELFKDAYAAGYAAGKARRVNWTPAPVLICLVLLALVVL